MKIFFAITAVVLLSGCQTTESCEYTKVITTMVDKCMRQDALGICQQSIKIPTEQKVCTDEPPQPEDALLK